MRKQIIAGNWKMNKTFQEAEEFLNKFSDMLSKNIPENTAVVICPPALYLEMTDDYARENNYYTGAQNISHNESGAFTGEISAMMLKSLNIRYCIVGHSERRKFFLETDGLIGKKVEMCLKHNIIPIYCCGELLSERDAGIHFDIVREQVETALFKLSKEDFSKVVIAYEPVWAIGTGVNATPEQAQEMHAFIRSLIEVKYKKKIASETTILYGGSCTAKNAAELFANPDVDGGLIGGASLKPDEFFKIIQSVKKS